MPDWKEIFVGNCVFYFGFFSKGDIRLGLTIGNREGSLDLLFFTIGYMR